MLEHITAVAPVRHARSNDSEPCKTCGERLEFSTNGMGVLLPVCPVCDLGFKPSREYAMYQERLAALQLPNRDASKMLSQPCAQCDRPFFPLCSAEIYCGDDCRYAAKREQLARAKRHERHCDRCGAFIVSLSGKAQYCGNCRLVRQAEQRRRYWQKKKLRGAA